ncbi:putative monocarboxylate transporter 3-like [Apostichopus japonicus]|uniref:Putative monocarboxylate transporter 3-like n=1 Tax=Stichopus japonicus TaxID=307972 RepID=A0A2G8JNI1_STIJA|nr:putative monocarboxylate transporter 3-like [Apostichopus japonicus]
MEKFKISAAMTIRLFFYLGSMKSLSVILNDTVSQTRGSIPLVALSFSILQGVAYVAAPPVIRLMKVVSSRTIVVVGGFLVGAGFICEAFLVSNLWTLYISIIISGVGFGLNNIPLYIAISDSFGDSFGTVMSVTGFFANIGIAVVPPLLEYWREKYGLAGALTLFGAFMWNQILSGVLIQSKANTEHSNDDKYNPIRDEEGRRHFTKPTRRISNCSEKLWWHLPSDRLSSDNALSLCSTVFSHVCIYIVEYLSSTLRSREGYEQGDAVLLSTFGDLEYCLDGLS